MEVGKWNKLPHYSVQGDATDMYLWVNEDGKGTSSGWIKGREAFKLFNSLKKLYKKDKKKFVERLKIEHSIRN